ncbi:membrane protein required for colicin V production [Rhodobacteraceae bacterium MBR-64]|jgi:membrane protein required for colicin V production
MEGFTIIDAVVAVVIVLSAILAYSRGFVRETMAILGWVAAAVLAYLFAPQVEPLIKEIPMVNSVLGESCELAIIAAFAVVFALALVLASLFTPLFSGVVQRSALGSVDHGLGFLFGVARGVILVTVAFVVYDRAMADASIPMVADSQSAGIFGAFEKTLSEQIPADAPGWIVARYEGLVKSCGVAETPANGAAPVPGQGA